MRRFLLIVAAAAFAAAALPSVSAVRAADTKLAADMDIPKMDIPKPAAKPPQDISVHKGPPNCSRWTDDCVNCSRGADGAPPVCSNIGLSCQPKPVRCLD